MTDDEPNGRRSNSVVQWIIKTLIYGTIFLVVLAAWALNVPIGGGPRPRTDPRNVQQQMLQLQTILDMYKLDIGRFPSAEEGLQALVVRPGDLPGWPGPYLRRKDGLIDAWNHPYLYRIPSSRPGLDYDLCSFGPTGPPGGSGANAPICNAPEVPF